jgi:hypothetical protein
MIRDVHHDPAAVQGLTTGSAAGALECGGLPPLYQREASFARKGGRKLPHSRTPTGEFAWLY